MNYRIKSMEENLTKFPKQKEILNQKITIIKQIKDELAKQGYKIEKSSIELTNNISSLGFHNVNINLYPEITAQIKVHVIK